MELLRLPCIRISRSLSRPLAKILILATALYLSALSADDEADVYSLSIAELLNITVDVASQKPESIIETPAIVSRYDMRDLEGMGLLTLIDVLRFIPGVLVEEALAGSITVQIRGLSDSYNQKVLFLLDDVPYWMPSHADIPLLGIPYESIDHVEVIRGPGAVIYGTNASAGVIKVSTKQEVEGALSVRTGERGLTNTNLRWSHAPTNDSYLNLALESQQFDGYGAEVNNATAPQVFTPTATGHVQRGSDFYSALVEMGYEDWRFIAHSFKSESLGNTTASIVETGQYIQEGKLLSVAKQWNFNDSTYKAYIDYNQYTLELAVDNILAIIEFPGSAGGFASVNNGDDNERLRAGTSVNLELSENIAVFAGIEFEERSAAEYVFRDSVNGAEVALFSPVPLPDGRETILIFPENRALERSVFTQLNYSKGAWRAFLGARYTNNNLFGSKTTPGAGLVFKLSERHSIKFLHSTGFNSPNFSQTPAVDGLGNPVNSELVAEEISTSDFSYNFVDENQLFVANLYYTEAKNLIVRSAVSGQPSNDSQNVTRSGFELDYQYKLNDWTLFANTGWLREGDDSPSVSVQASIYPEFEIAFGGRYQLSDSQAIGTSLESLSDRQGSGELTIINLSYTHQICESCQLALSLRNILNEKTLAPDPRGINQYQMQNREPKNIQLSFKYTF